MEIVIVAIQIVLTLFLLIGLGVFLTWRGFLDERANDLLSFLVVKVGLPAMVIYNMLKHYTREDLLGSILSLIVPALTMIVTYFLSGLIAKLIRVKKNRQGVFRAMFTFSNTMFIGLPVNVAIFGEATIPFTMLYYVSQQFIFWTLGITGIRRDGEGDGPRMFSKEGLKKLMSVPLIAFLVGLALVLLNVEPPKFLMDAMEYTGATVTALSQIFTGVVLFKMGFKRFRIDFSMIVMCIGRFILSPLLVYLVNLVIPLPHLTLQTFLLQACMPIMSQTAILARAHGGDSEYATVGMLLTTVLSIVFVPLYAFIGTLV